MDLEDGELPSSPAGEDISDTSVQPASEGNAEMSGILDDSDYVILDRPRSEFLRTSSNPTSSSSNTGLKQNTSSNMSVSSSPVEPVNIVRSSVFKTGALNALNFPSMPDSNTYGKKGYYQGLGVSDLVDSSDKDSSTSDSDDDDNFVGKRSRMNVNFPSDNGTSASSKLGDAGVFGHCSFASTFSNKQLDDSNALTLNCFNSAAQKFQKQHQQQRKPNLVWTNLMEEEQISNIFEGVKVAEPGIADVEVTRGPETYSFQRPMRQPRQRRESDSSDISSGGLSDNALHYLRDGCSFDDEETGESSEHSLPVSFTSSSASKSLNSRKATKKRRDRQKYKRKLIARLKKMKSEDLGKYMGTKLVEEKVSLLVKAIQCLGKENCIHIFLKTLKIEKRGGILVKNQQRRRTPGGVYFYLIRGDRRFSKSSIDLIFRDDRAFQDKVKRKKQVVKRRKNKAKLESALELEGMKDDEEDSEDTAVPGREQDGTDVGHYGDESTQESSIPERDTDTADMHCDGSES